MVHPRTTIISREKENLHQLAAALDENYLDLIRVGFQIFSDSELKPFDPTNTGMIRLYRAQLRLTNYLIMINQFVDFA